MRAGQVWLDAISQKVAAAPNAIPDSTARTNEPEKHVISYVHAAGKTQVELTLPECQKCTSKRNPLQGEWVVFSPTIEMPCPRHADGNEFVHDSLSIQK